MVTWLFLRIPALIDQKNKTKYNRRILYYTYLDKKFGSQYNAYFKDKKLSKNKSIKSLSGEK